MKKIYLLSAAVLSILAAASCAKEENGPETFRTVISASIAPTKTALGEKDGDAWPNYWKTGDQISVNGVTSEALGSEADGKATATFSFESLISTPYNAVYPASAVSGYSDGSATVTLPASQNYVAGSYDPAAFIMGGKSTNEAKLTLSPCVSVIHLSLTGTASISKVKLTGAENTALSGSFTTDFNGYTPKTVSNVVEMVAETPVALPAEFFICVPAGLSGALNVAVFDAEGGTMSKNATLRSALAPGQVYSPAALAYTASYDIAITAEGITSSTAVICWDNAPEAPYTISVYSDAAGSALVDSYAVDAGNACWGGQSPRFCISGLASGTTYYVKVTNTAHNVDSNLLPVTTEDFTIVQVSSTPAEEGDVILAEDFSELRWDCDMIGVGAGWFPTQTAQETSFGTLEIGSFQAAATSNEKRISAQTIPVAASRLYNWAQGANPHMYVHPGYIKLVGEKKVTHLVTPALNNIPDGMAATLEVEVTASRYFSESSNSFTTDKAIVAVQTDTEIGDLVANATNTLDLESNIASFTLAEEVAWNTYKVTLSNVSKGNRLAFGAAKSVSGNDARMNISDIKVTIKQLYEPGSISLSLKSVSSSTAAFTWTHIGYDAAYDISKPYTASLYSDSNCTELVVSHSFEADASCWDGKSPCFSFGGLAPSTTYWLVVEDTESDTASEAVSVTTEAFTPVDATTVTNAAVGDVLLAEDFSEVGWGPDVLSVAAGFVPAHKDLTIPSGMNPEGSFTVYDNTGSRFFGAGVDLGDSRLSHGWGFFGNSSVYLHTAYSRVGASGGRTHVVTPALSGIPAGKQATIDVTVTATKYDSPIQLAVFAEKGLTLNTEDTPSSPSYRKYTGASLSDGHVLDISTVRDWDTKTVRLSKVDSECQLLIGSLADNGGKNRFFISDVVVTLVELKDPGTIDIEVDIQDFATFKAFLEACEPGKVVKGNVVADITLTSEQVAEIDNLYPVDEFDGILNGNNHTIAGLTKPLFNKFSGTASNLTLNSTLNLTTATSNIGIFAQTATDATLAGCVSTGSVTSSATEVSGDLALGGLIGSISGCTLTACQNQAAVTNNSVVDGTAYIGGIVGVADGANTLSASGENKNINSGAVSENSSTTDIVIGGVVAYATGGVSDFSYCRNEGKVTVGGEKHSIYIGGVAGGFNNASVLDYASNSGQPTFSSVIMDNSSSYIRLGGVIGGWFSDGCTSQTITGCTNTAAITIVSDDLKLDENTSGVADCFGGGIAGGGKKGSECGKALVNCTNSGAITIGNSGSYNSGKIFHRFCLGGIIGYTDVNPTGSKCIANIRFRSTRGTNRVGGIAGEMKIGEIHDVTYKGTVNTNGTSGTNFTGGLVGNVGTGTRTFTNCTVSGTMRGPNSTTLCAGIFFSCNGSGGPTVNIASCTVGSGTRIQTASSGYAVTITSADQITAENVCGTNGTNRTCTTGTNDGLSIVVDPNSITL